MPNHDTTKPPNPLALNSTQSNPLWLLPF